MTEKKYYLLGIQELEELDPEFTSSMSIEDQGVLAKIKANINIEDESETIQELDFVLIKKLHTTDFPKSEVLKKIYDRLVKENNVGTYEGFNTILEDELENSGEHINFKKEDGGDLEDSEKQINFTLKYTKDEIWDLIHGKQEKSDRTLIQTISSYVRANARTGPEGRAKNGDHWSKEKEKELIAEYVDANHLWYDEDLLIGKYFTEGGEQKVYRLNGDYVVKINDCGFYLSWLDYLESLLLHNFFFSPETTYELLGFTWEEGELFSVVKQPWVEETRPTTKSEIQALLKDIGFENIPGSSNYYNPTLCVGLMDIHTGNVLTKKDGVRDVLYFIDTIAYITREPKKFEQGGSLKELTGLEAIISAGRQDYQTRAALTVITWLKADENPNDEQNTGLVVDNVKKAIQDLKPSVLEIEALFKKERIVREDSPLPSKTDVLYRKLTDTVKLYNAYQKVLELYEAWKIKKEMATFDYDTLYREAAEPDHFVEANKMVEQDEKREEVYQKSGFDKKWAPTYKIAVEKLKEKYLIAKANKETWEAKQYKKGSKKSVEVGEELSGGKYSVDYINENKRQKVIRGAQMNMDEAKEDLQALGLGKEEIAALLAPDEKVGKEFWFEYHCDESPASSDYTAYLHSHQRVKVLSISEPGGGDTRRERDEVAEPRVYKVQFSDGLTWDVFEDELVNSESEFYRPAPPKKKESHEVPANLSKPEQNILEIASELVKSGKSTPENAFPDAIKLVDEHSNSMIEALASERPGYTKHGVDEVYLNIAHEMAKSAHKKITDDLEQKAVHKYQWMRNKEGGQSYGTQQIIVPEDEAIFEKDSKPLLRKDIQKLTFEQYKKKFGQLYMSYIKREGRGEWELSKSDSLEKLIPHQSRFDNGWVKEVTDFNSPEAIKQGNTADSEAVGKPLPKPIFPQGKELLDMTVADISNAQGELTSYYFDELIEPIKKEITALQGQLKALPTRSQEKSKLRAKIEEFQGQVQLYDANRERDFLDSWEALEVYLIQYTLGAGLIDVQKVDEEDRDSLFAEMLSQLATYTFERERESTWDQKLIDVWLGIVRDNLFEGELKLGKGYKVPEVFVLAANKELPEPVAAFVEYVLTKFKACKLITAGYNSAPVEDVLPCWTVQFECFRPFTQQQIITAFEHNIKVLTRKKEAGAYETFFLLPYKIGPGEASAAKNYFTQLEFAYARDEFYNLESKTYEDKLKWFKTDLEELQAASPQTRYEREKMLYIDPSTSYAPDQLIVFFDSQPEGARFNVLLHGNIVSAYQNYIPAIMVKKEGFYDLIRKDDKKMVAEGRASFQIVDLIMEHQVTVMTEKSPYPKISVAEKQAIEELPQEQLPAPTISMEFETESPDYGTTTCVTTDLAYAIEQKSCPCGDGNDYHFNEHELDQLKDILSSGETQSFVPAAKLKYPFNWIAKMKVDGNVLHLPTDRMSTAEYGDVKRILQKSGGSYKKNAFEFPEPALDVYLRILGGEDYNLKKKYQYFGTPAATGDYMVKLADIKCGMSFCEPSAGRAALINAIRRVCPDAKIDYCEAMPSNLAYLKSIDAGNFICEDFLNFKKHSNNKNYDRIIANPPFSKNQDESHITLMYELLAPKGRLVTVASPHWQFAADKQSTAFREWIAKIGAQVIDVPAGTFKESGTSMPTVIIVAEKK